MKQSDLSNPVALAKIIAASNSNNIPVNATGSSYASQTEGFPEITMIPEEQGGEAPHGKDFNGFLRILTSHMFNIQNGTPETFNPEVSNLIGGYPKDAQLWLINSTTSRLLKSTKDDNTDNFLTTPSVIGTSWIDAFPTKDYVDSKDTNLQSQITTNANNIATKANNNAVVHLSDTETITGAKTFTSNVTQSNGAPREILKNTDCVKGTAPSANEVMSVQFMDKNGDLLGIVQTNYDTTRKTVTQLRAYKAQSASDTDSISIGVGYTANGNRYSWAPTPTLSSSDSSYSEQIVTVGWIDGSNSNLVHRTGNETIAGTKTFTSNPYIKNTTAHLYMNATNQTKGTAPSADVWSSVTFQDKNVNLMGRCRQIYSADKSNRVELQVHKANSSSDTDNATMGIKYPANGSAYGFAPASDVNGSIVTTTGINKA